MNRDKFVDNNNKRSGNDRHRKSQHYPIGNSRPAEHRFPGQRSIEKELEMKPASYRAERKDIDWEAFGIPVPDYLKPKVERPTAPSPQLHTYMVFDQEDAEAEFLPPSLQDAEAQNWGQFSILDHPTFNGSPVSGMFENRNVLKPTPVQNQESGGSGNDWNVGDNWNQNAAVTDVWNSELHESGVKISVASVQDSEARRQTSSDNLRSRCSDIMQNNAFSFAGKHGNHQSFGHQGFESISEAAQFKDSRSRTLTKTLHDSGPWHQEVNKGQYSRNNSDAFSERRHDSPPRQNSRDQGGFRRPEEDWQNRTGSRRNDNGYQDKIRLNHPEDHHQLQNQDNQRRFEDHHAPDLSHNAVAHRPNRYDSRNSGNESQMNNQSRGHPEDNRFDHHPNQNRPIRDLSLDELLNQLSFRQCEQVAERMKKFSGFPDSFQQVQNQNMNRNSGNDYQEEHRRDGHDQKNSCTVTNQFPDFPVDHRQSQNDYGNQMDNFSYSDDDRRGRSDQNRRDQRFNDGRREDYWDQNSEDRQNQNVYQMSDRLLNEPEGRRQIQNGYAKQANNNSDNHRRGGQGRQDQRYMDQWQEDRNQHNQDCQGQRFSDERREEERNYPEQNRSNQSCDYFDHRRMSSPDRSNQNLQRQESGSGNQNQGGRRQGNKQRDSTWIAARSHLHSLLARKAGPKEFAEFYDSQKIRDACQSFQVSDQALMTRLNMLKKCKQRGDSMFGVVIKMIRDEEMFIRDNRRCVQWTEKMWRFYK